MEIIGYGILLAIGFYIAPMVITMCIGFVYLVVGGVYNLFKGN